MQVRKLYSEGIKIEEKIKQKILKKKKLEIDLKKRKQPLEEIISNSKKNIEKIQNEIDIFNETYSNKLEEYIKTLIYELSFYFKFNKEQNNVKIDFTEIDKQRSEQASNGLSYKLKMFNTEDFLRKSDFINAKKIIVSRSKGNQLISKVLTSIQKEKTVNDEKIPEELDKVISIRVGFMKEYVFIYYNKIFNFLCNLELEPDKTKFNDIKLCNNDSVKNLLIDLQKHLQGVNDKFERFKTIKEANLFARYNYNVENFIRILLI